MLGVPRSATRVRLRARTGRWPSDSPRRRTRYRQRGDDPCQRGVADPVGSGAPPRLGRPSRDGDRPALAHCSGDRRRTSRHPAPTDEGITAQDVATRAGWPSRCWASAPPRGDDHGVHQRGHRHRPGRGQRRDLHSSEITLVHPPTWTVVPGVAGQPADHRVIAHLSTYGIQAGDACTDITLPARWRTSPPGEASIIITSWPMASLRLIRRQLPAGLGTDATIGGAPAAFRWMSTDDGAVAWWQLSTPGFPDRWIEVHASLGAVSSSSATVSRRSTRCCAPSSSRAPPAPRRGVPRPSTGARPTPGRRPPVGRRRRARPTRRDPQPHPPRRAGHRDRQDHGQRAGPADQRALHRLDRSEQPLRRHVVADGDADPRPSRPARPAAARRPMAPAARRQARRHRWRPMRARLLDRDWPRADTSTTTGLPFEDGHSPTSQPPLRPPRSRSCSEPKATGPMRMASSQDQTGSHRICGASSRRSTRPATRTTASVAQAGPVCSKTFGKTTDLDRPLRSSTVATSIAEPARVMTRRELDDPPTVTLAWSASSARSPV